jgi:hypothetical protein
VAIPNPRTWIANVTAFSAAIMNADMRDAINFLMGRGGGCKDYARLTLTGTQPTLTSGTSLAIPFNAEDWDLRGGHSTSSAQSRYVFQESGKYTISGQMAFAANANGDRIAYVSLNGVTIILASEGRACAVATTFQAWSVDYAFNAGDYIELIGLQTSGVALALSALNGGTVLCVEWKAV